LQDIEPAAVACLGCVLPRKIFSLNDLGAKSWIARSWRAVFAFLCLELSAGWRTSPSWALRRLSQGCSSQRAEYFCG